ncbi:MAG: L-rhamnose mutarotase [Bacteroidales bacterium]|nr:L-rhamnose mutarotase [Bacteroidales bacterium]
MKNNMGTLHKRYYKTMELCDVPSLIEEYKKAHAKGTAWPEITQGMKDVGIIDMEIYLLGTRLFIIMVTISDFDHDKAMAELAMKPRQKKWEEHMSKFQDTSAEATIDQKWQLMERIYKMDE